MASAYRGTWKTGKKELRGEPEPIANPALVGINRLRARRIALASVIIAAVATAGIALVPLR